MDEGDDDLRLGYVRGSNFKTGSMEDEGRKGVREKEIGKKGFTKMKV